MNFATTTATIILIALAATTTAQSTAPKRCSVPQNARLRFERDCSWYCNQGFVLRNASYCCPAEAPAGQYMKCDATGFSFSSCPTSNTTNIQYGRGSTNNCPYLKCPQPLVLSTADQTLLTTKCAVTNNTLSPECQPFVQTVCRGICPPGQTLLTKFPNDPVLDADGNFQCMPCSDCPAGTDTIRPCGVSGIAACAVRTRPRPMFSYTYIYTYDINLLKTWKDTSATFPMLNGIANQAGGYDFLSNFDTSTSRFTSAVTLTDYAPCVADPGFRVVDTNASTVIQCTSLKCPRVAQSRLCPVERCPMALNANETFVLSTNASACQKDCAPGFSGNPCVACNATATNKPLQATYTSTCAWQCNPGYFRYQNQCLPHDTSASCPQSTFLIQPSATSNKQCSNCTACASNEYVSMPCTATSDTVCKQCTTCTAGALTLSSCSSTRDTKCAGCAGCPSDQYVAQMCSAQGPTVCGNCSQCDLGSYTVQKCTGMTDTRCRPCPMRLPMYAKWGPNCDWACDPGFTAIENFCAPVSAQPQAINNLTLTKAKLLNESIASAICNKTAYEQQLSKFFTSPTYIVKFTLGNISVSCFPTPCPCVRRRRLLQVASSPTPDATISMTYAYDGPVQPVDNIDVAVANIAEVVVLAAVDPGTNTTAAETTSSSTAAETTSTTETQSTTPSPSTQTTSSPATQTTSTTETQSTTSSPIARTTSSPATPPINSSSVIQRATTTAPATTAPDNATTVGPEAGLVVGATVGGVAGLMVVVFIMWQFVCKPRRKNLNKPVGSNNNGSPSQIKASTTSIGDTLKIDIPASSNKQQ